MVTIACVQVRDYESRGAEYVNKLHDMVRRNIANGTVGRFVCFTDQPEGYSPGVETRPLPPGLNGWWNKLWLFSPDAFPAGERVIFLDLDTLVIGAIDDLVAYQGPFAILRDFFNPAGLGSAVMAWEAGMMEHIWQEWHDAGCPMTEGGDQTWIQEVVTNPVILQDVLPGMFCSYKADCHPYPPKGTKICCFHGQPRPHMVDGWVKEVWTEGGIGGVEIEVYCNTETEQLRSNVESALMRGLPELAISEPHNGTVCIIGGGPSAIGFLDDLRNRQRNDQQIWAVNGSAKWLARNGITADATWIVDARPENTDFLTSAGGPFYLASQCAQELFDAADLLGLPVTLWHELQCQNWVPETAPLIGGGSTVGCKAVAGAYALGYRRLKLFGFDSSYSEFQHHSYLQAANDDDAMVDAWCAERRFRTAPWMVQQVHDVLALHAELIAKGCVVDIFGDGLLPHALRSSLAAPEIVDGRFQRIGGFLWPLEDREGAHHILREVQGLPSILNHCYGRRCVVQAGGNVGVYPVTLAHSFQKVITLEPDRENFLCLDRNTADYPNIQTVWGALGATIGSAGLQRHPTNVGAHYILGSGDIVQTTIDSFDLDACDLIMLDVEGSELNALKGAEKTIRRLMPVVVIEDNGLGTRFLERRGDALAWLQQFGYNVAEQIGNDYVCVNHMAVSAAA